ncbi:hypothetical protein BJ508DRAFT_128376 [Ascobolus immersus RN42]|uniref:Uncharacterized protein n=1 Tax=Ascobolus immersus RN42 TaxID=1160509 RepID=A0A3N4I568_ASCIM|nr:hypothetical protein BJ508DRAFT_128376 [Ascobolus immersus RN42]
MSLLRFISFHGIHWYRPSRNPRLQPGLPLKRSRQPTRRPQIFKRRSSVARTVPYSLRHPIALREMQLSYLHIILALISTSVSMVLSSIHSPELNSHLLLHIRLHMP